jgi:hypothetical protein
MLKSVRDKGAAEVEEARRATAAALTDRDALKDALASVRGLTGRVGVPHCSVP